MFRIVALGLLVGLVAAIKFLPWWAVLGLTVVVGGLTVFLGKHLVQRFFIGAFRKKSAVLAGASARIHSIQPAGPPKPDEDDDDEMWESEEPRHWRLIDMDIIVAEQTNTPMTFWDPGDLALVGENARGGEILDEEEEDVAEIHGIEVQDGSEWITCDGKLTGSQRIRLHVAAREGIDRFRLRYYFEILKNVG